MFIYYLTQNTNRGYDTYDSCVVAATSKRGAQKIRPDDSTWEKDHYNSWADTPEQVNVEYLGIAKEGTKTGVILASFNAG